MPRIRVSTSAPTLSFDDSDPVVNGIGNFGAALWQAPVEAAAIRNDRDRELWQMKRADEQDAQHLDQQNNDRAFRDREAGLHHQEAADSLDWQKQNRQDQMDWQRENADANRAVAEKYHDQTAQYHKDEINRHNQDENRHMLRDAGTGVMNWLKGVTKSDDKPVWTFHHDNEGNTYRRNSHTGDVQQVVPQKAPTPPHVPTEAEVNTQRTGYPDGEFNWYNPMDWTRSPPAPGAHGTPAGAPAGAPPGAPPVTPGAEPMAPQVDPATQFQQLSGLQPANPQHLQALIGGDSPRRTAVLQSMPAAERIRAIQALKQMGHQ